MSYVEKLLLSSRTLIVLLSITMGFTIAIYFNSKKEHTVERGTESPSPVKVADVDTDFSAPGQQEDLRAIQTKLDKILRDTVMRDAIIVGEVLKLQHQNGMHLRKHPMCPSCARNPQNVAKVSETR